MTEKHPKRPRDPNQLAKLMVDIATGGASDAEETTFTKRASKAGTVGGPARAKSLTPAQRSEIARVSPAMAAGVTDKLWEIADIAKLVEDAEEAPKKRGPYRKRTA